ncbi:MAG: putative Ig domain-containing protein [Desulfurivibrionaceae bacterium]
MANTAPTFTMGDGRVTTGVGIFGQGWSVAVQADGKILLGGHSDFNFALARYNVDGSLDATFGTGGKLTTDFGSHDYGRSIAVQDDGKILLGGESNGSFALARYNTDGSLDATFGAGGKLTTDFGISAAGHSIKVQADGQILVGGEGNGDLALVRYNTDGSLDTTFDADGKVTTDFGSTYEHGDSVAIQADGKILLAGQSYGDFALVLYNTDGSLDATFDGDGKLTTDFGGNDSGRSVVVQEDGKILIGGDTNSTVRDYALARYNADGSLDASFGSDGKLTTDLGSMYDLGFSVALQADGKILLGGSGGTGFMLARYNEDGSLDTDFDTDGKVSANFGGDDYGRSLALQPDGKILLGGFNTNGFALARFNADGSLDTSFGAADSLGGTVAFTTLGAAVVLDSSVMIADAELDARNGGAGDYAGARVTLSRHGGARSDDAFDFVATGAAFTVEGNSLLAGGLAFGTWSQNNGTLRIAFTSSGTMATNALVDNVLEHIAYRNMGFAPTASVQIDWTLTDSQIVAGEPLPPLADMPRSVTGSTTVSITAISHANTAPDFSTLPPGIVTTPVGTDRDDARALALQADGKLLAAGFSYDGSNYDFAVVRYNPDGSLDTSFSGDGKLTTAIGSSDDYAYSVATQADGKILVAGKTYIGATGFVLASVGGNSANWSSALARYNADGSLDTTFSSDGKLTTTFGSNNTVGRSLAVQADGKILLAGYSGSAHMDFALLRYNADGSFDTSFGTGGGVTTDIDSSSNDYGTAVAVQADGRIVVAGSSNGNFALARYNSNGSLDTNFSGDGRLTTAIAASNVKDQYLALQTDGKILVAGSSNNGGDFTVVRYNPDGSLDIGFGGDGMVTTAIGSNYDYASRIALQTDGKIVVAGSSWNGSDDDVALVRYNSDGSLDTSFSDDGLVTTDVNGVSNDGYGVAVQADGKIVVVGQSYKTGGPHWDSDFVVIRYNSDGSLDTAFESEPTSDALRLFHAGGTPILLDTSLAFSDAELDALNAGAGDYAGASVTLARFDDANADDVFGFDFSGSSISITGNSIQSAGQVFATFGHSAGTLVISLDSSETVATHALLQETLEHITYQNTNVAPPAEVRIEWTLNDGNTGDQGLGQAISTSGSSVVAVSAAAYSPALTRLIADQAVIEGQAFSLALPADTFVDGDAGDSLSYSAALVNGAALPAWLVFDPDARSFSGTPMLADLGSIEVQVSVADQSGHTASGIFGIAVALTTIQGSDWHDALTGGSADEAIVGLAGDDTLDGAAGSDRIDGGDGNDVLIGGSGSDTLNGGADSDIFRYTAKTDSTATAMDVITDFASGDTLDFVGMGGVARQPLAYTYQANVATTLAGIQADASISNATVFFDDGSSGYLYIKGSGSGVDFDGSLIQLAGPTTVLGSGEITALNRAPSISGTSTLPGIEEDSSPTGIRVSTLLAGTDYADLDPGDLGGIAVVGASTVASGLWQYSIDDSTWIGLGTVSNGQAILLNPDSYVRFLPQANYDGSASLTLRAWDQTSGQATTRDLQQTADTTVNGGITALSSGTHTVQIAVAPVNDAPLIRVGGDIVRLPSASNLVTTNSINVQVDGKIVLAGVDDGNPNGNTDFALARYNADGSLDANFGVGGRVTTGIRTGNEWVEDAAMQQDGKIVVTGSGYETNSYDAEIVLVRYNADGSLDSSFSDDGKLTTDLVGSYQDVGHSVAVQSDGRILVAGDRGYGVGNSGNYDFALVRYNTDGSLDTSFNGNGIAITDFAGGNDTAQDVVILGDGKIIVAGTADAAGQSDFALARYNVDGSLDTGFSDDGKLTTDIGAGYDWGSAVTLQPDGKILLAGSIGQTDHQFAVARYNSDGSLDAGFGGDGIVTTAFPSAYSINGQGVLVQNDGRILVSGNCHYYGSSPDPMIQTAPMLVRYNTDGSLDTGFGDAGMLVADSGAVISVLPDGKILVAGGAGFALARYNSDGTLDTSFGIPTYEVHGTPVVLDPTATIKDVELGAIGGYSWDIGALGNYSGASLTLTRHGGADPHDAFSASGNLGPLTPGGALVLSHTAIGTVSANAAGMLTISFNAEAAQARVDETLSSIAYANTSETPPDSVQIDWTFSDGNTGDQGSGGAMVASGSTTVSVIFNHAPTLSNPISNETAIAESPFSFVVPANTFADVDAGDTLSYTATLSNATALPGWLVFDSALRSFSGVPPSSAVGGMYVRVTGTDSSNASVSDVFLLTVANLITGTTGDDTISGSLNPDVIHGLDGNDSLIGSEGNDSLDGGAGDDILIGEGAATDLTLSGYGSEIIIIGSDTHVDVLSGGDGNDVLDDWLGNNTMIGGAGDDTYVGSFVEVIELVDGGNDTILSYGTLSLPDNVENVTMLGSYYATVTGNELDNRLIGNSGRNVLIGGAGNDTIDGGAENDKLIGGAGADSLQGGEGDDVFLINSVTDFAVGEIIDGGNGINELSYSGTGAATLVLTSLVSHISTVRLAVADGDINIDASATVGAYDFTIIVGNAGNNHLVGNGSDNSLYGGFGDDTLVGGDGNDLLNGNAGNDVFLIAAGTDHGTNEYIDGEGGSSGGINQIRFTSTLDGDTLTLSSHISNIQTVAISDDSGALNGTLALNVNATAMSAGVALIGNAGANMLVGSSGNDVLIGGSGSDTLSGGAGGDIFRYTAKTDSTATAIDVITDFASGDTLDFVGMGGVARQPLAYAYQANVATTLAGIQADAFISNTTVFFDDGSNGYLYIKGSGSGVDFDGSLIQLAGHVATLGPDETGLNAAPTISGTSTLADIAEDSSPAGIRVSSVLAGTDFADADSGDLQGIAVVGVGISSLGVWTYSTDGSTWNFLSNPSSSEALLLDANSEISFQPWPDSAGIASLTLRAWDQTSGIASTNDLPQLANTWINGGTTAFSSGTHDLQVTVTPTNDAPSIRLGATKTNTYSGPNYLGATSMAVQADGKIVLVGGKTDGYLTDYADFVVARFNVDGSLDTSFGVDGKVTTDIRSGADRARDVAIQQDGKIVVAGYGKDANDNDPEVVVVRYNVDGSLDTSFSGDGKLTTDLDSWRDPAYSIAVQDDGKILVAGSSSADFMASGDDFALVRYNPDGTLDTSFNGDGIATAGFTGGSHYGKNNLAILDDGKILIAGTAGISADTTFAVARFNADGSLDTSFSGDGKLTTDIGSTGYAIASALAVQADGKILQAGQSGNQLALVRYNSDGSLDLDFSGDGIVRTAFQSIWSIDVKSLVVQNDGKILVSGYGSFFGFISYPSDPEPTIEIAPGVTIPAGQNHPAVLVRYNSDGSLDTGFATGGILVANAGGVVEVQSDGKILVAGGDGFALARYNSDGTLDTSFGIPTYREQGTPVILDRTATVFDLELDATGNYAGAVLSLARHGGADAHDLFSASGNLGPLTPGGVLTLSGTTIGTVSANDGGLLTLAFDVNATQAQVNEALSSIAYANTGGTPPAPVQIDWTFSDGNTGAQGSGGALAATGSTLINIAAANNIPIGTVGVGGTATQGHILTATDTLTDADGLGVISYQWQSSLDGTVWHNADTGPTLTLTPSLVGQQIRAVVRYTDSNGTTESVASLATPKVMGYQSGTPDNDNLHGTAYADTLLGLAGNDTLFSGEGNDLIDGGHGADQMEGEAGDDTYLVDNQTDTVIEHVGDGTDTIQSSVSFILGNNVENLILTGNDSINATGNSLNNILTGNSSNNILDGSAGIDTAVFNGNLAAHTLTKAASGLIVQCPGSFTDSLLNIERIQFDDQTVNLTVEANAASITTPQLQRLEELYVAFFNRVPDADGLSYWIDIFKAGYTIDQIAEAFYNAGVQYEELTDHSPTMSHEDFVTVIYRNALGRAEPDAEGLAFWSGALAEGLASRGELVSAILDSAHTYKGDPDWGWVADLLDSKIMVAEKFAVEWGLNYNTPEESITQGMAIAAAVTPTGTEAAIALIGIMEEQMDLW